MANIEWHDGKDWISFGDVGFTDFKWQPKPKGISPVAAAIEMLKPATLTFTGRLIEPACAHPRESLDIVHGVGLVRQCDDCHEITAKL